VDRTDVVEFGSCVHASPQRLEADDQCDVRSLAGRGHPAGDVEPPAADLAESVHSPLGRGPVVILITPPTIREPS
jgi:hypothetical protein